MRRWGDVLVAGSIIALLALWGSSPEARPRLAWAGGGALLFGWMAHRARLLDASGAVVGSVLAASVVGLGGWAWAVPAFTFFALSSALSKVGRRRKAKAEALSEKGSVRDAGQVYANGGVAWGLLLVYTAHPAEVIYWGFLGAFAAAAADTWATELGTLSGTRPRLVTSWKSVSPGTSGAVSLAGTVGAGLGAVVVVASAYPFLEREAAVSSRLLALGIAGSGLAGALVDSLAGAAWQALYRDEQTGQLTERPDAPQERRPLVQGYRWVTNDRVNELCTLTGALLAMGCFQAYVFVS